MLKFALVYDYHVILGAIAAAVGVASFVPYFRDIFKGTTKPHPFTYLVWSLINGIAFFAQDIAGGGPGAWVSAVVTIECFVIAIISLRHGEKHITRLDWWCFALALLGIVLWRLTDSPLVAVIFVTLADGLACIPTFRKSYMKPEEETVSSYALGALRSFLSLPALTIFSLTTALYPAFIGVVDLALVIFLVVRRRQLHTSL